LEICRFENSRLEICRFENSRLEICRFERARLLAEPQTRHNLRSFLAAEVEALPLQALFRNLQSLVFSIDRPYRQT